MKNVLVLLILLLPVIVANAQHKPVHTPDSMTEYKVKWTWKLPQPVRKAWLNSGYADWMLNGIKKIVTPTQTLYTIHVYQVQSLGPDDADIGDEFILYFSDKGELVKKERVDR